MPRKNVLAPHLLVSAVSMAADITSDPVNIQFTDNVSIQCNITTSDAIGPIYIQGSLDYSPGTPGYPVANSGNWSSITLDPQPAAASANDVILYDLNQLSFPWIRVFFDRTSGTGTMSVYVSCKEV